MENELKADLQRKRPLREIILEVLSESTGVRSNQFVVDVISYIRDNGIDCSTENLVVEIDACINDGLIMEIDYVVPASNWRIRSLLLPKDSQIIHIANHGATSNTIFLPIHVKHFNMLREWQEHNIVNKYPELVPALCVAAQKFVDTMASRNLANEEEK
jgi:hypothetical protein